MRISDARRRPVVATGAATTLGHVDGFLIEAEAARITGLRIDADGGTCVLPWDKIGAFGPDAITVGSADVLREPMDLAEQRQIDPELDPIGKPALEETGNGLGTVSDVDFDPDSGRLRSIITEVYELPAEKLMGLGTFAMVFGDTRGLTPA